ncbi:hypothetical protein B0H16DRAFT_1451496 [Mycena metata]|uniref:F-box domain-containing protein n=1 Tax=Mycena metata TaxID=1033252 RepID=A0AAD7JXL0_9AGAR|nr:hypothetical protein B0H16DRAFT_1451496 [Mycena metata]
MRPISPNRMGALSCPAHRIPVELFEEIFALCHPSLLRHWTMGMHLDRVAQGHLLDLAHVRSAWNRIVKGTPSLWCTIELPLMSDLLGAESMPPTAMGTIMHLLRLSLDRSRNYLLDIHIYTDMWAGPVIDLVAQHSRRWRHTDIYINESAFRFLSPVRGALPELQSLSIDEVQLEDLAFEIEFTHLPFGTPRIPWEQLQTIVYGKAESSRLNSAFASLSRCPPGSEVVFNIVWFDHEADIEDLAPVGASISDFAFTMVLGDNTNPGLSRLSLGALLTALTLPSLQRLSLTGRIYPLFWTHPHFDVFASRLCCGSTLLGLDLHSTVITEEQLVATLSALPALKSLCVQDVPAGNTRGRMSGQRTYS